MKKYDWTAIWTLGILILTLAGAAYKIHTDTVGDIKAMIQKGDRETKEALVLIMQIEANKIEASISKDLTRLEGRVEHMCELIDEMKVAKN